MAKTLGPKKAQRYSVEFKLKAVKLSELEGVQVQDVADALDGVLVRRPARVHHRAMTNPQEPAGASLGSLPT